MTKAQSTNIRGKALITDASSGIGAMYADRLAKRGYDLILVTRGDKPLANLNRRIASDTGRSIENVIADLASMEGVRKVESVLKTAEHISLLVNNAGLGSATPLLEADLEKMDEIIRLNVIALTRLTYAAIPPFVARGGGTVINVASIVALLPETLNGVYGGTKSYVLAFTLSLQHELVDKQIRVQAVLPGPTATEFWDAAGKPLHQLPLQIVMSAEDLVDAALIGLDLGESVTIPSLADNAMWDRYEAARRAMAGRLCNAIVAPRYSRPRHKPKSG